MIIEHKKYPYAFSKIKIKNIEFPNRLVFPGFSFNYANDDGTVSSELLDFYKDLSVPNGPGLIIAGGAPPTSKSMGFTNDFRIYHDKFIPGISNLMDQIKKNGSIPGVQLLTFGRQGFDPVKPLLAPSPIPCPTSKRLSEELGVDYKIREMNLEEINALIEDYINASIRAKKAGAKLIELNAAHGYLLNQFISPHTNQRKDLYGGNIENRARIIIEIIQGIRKKLQDEVLISIRVSGDEFFQDGNKPKDFKEIIPMMESSGIDLLNISVGMLENGELLYPFIYSKGKIKKQGEAIYSYISEELKSYSNIPVCYCGFVSSVETAEQLLSEGKADMIAMARAQVADPQLVKKTYEGKENYINKCVYDDKCLFFMTGDEKVYCTVNPKLRKSL